MAATPLTLESLTAAIRSAGSLDELLRLIGPSEEENQQARARLALLESVTAKCEWGNPSISLAAHQARERYGHIMAEQIDYENRYL